ncbi:MAG TPA: Eco57I restriction-modification methylase domain-containing protein, partial [Ktedonobacteraceae bacterium]|nr:Eco57I restriction-modification methylase domain-containing protein [Ktedonobacteraceae bacterium]
MRVFDIEHVTQRFYERFQKEHAAFLRFIEGIPSPLNRQWYASLMLTRLMFVYFIQKKGFLDNNVNYLPEKLKKMQTRIGQDTLLSFYHHFLLRLFFEGFGQPLQARASDLKQLLGDVPFLDGGFFQVHELERNYSGIAIPDEAFERIFTFFDSYQWQIDEQPLHDAHASTMREDEINPDVIGYIFEKYINQKQMGAYYTKRDICEYLSKHAIIPYLFHAIQAQCPLPFKADGPIWRLLASNPDRYIPHAIRNEAYLATESEREYQARHNRYTMLKDKLRAGQVTSIDDFITCNLDSMRFLQDVILQSEEPALLRAFYETLEAMTILDPTCGSGAFLFAALNILEPLYAACLERMRVLVACWEERVGASQVGQAQGPLTTTSPPLAPTPHHDRAAQHGDGGHDQAGTGPIRVRQPGQAQGPLTTTSPPLAPTSAHVPALGVVGNDQGVTGDVGARGGADGMRGPCPFSGEICAGGCLCQHDIQLFRTILQRVDQHVNHSYFILKAIALNNLYGVDIMKEAVEICKLRLFLKLAAQLKSVTEIEPLPDIDFNIRPGNTLVGFAHIEEVRKVIERDQQKKLAFSQIMERIQQKARMIDQEFSLHRQQQTQQGERGHDFEQRKNTRKAAMGELASEIDGYLASQYGIDRLHMQDEAAYQQAFEQWRSSHLPFHWFIEFYGIMERGGFDVIIGNPPYVEYSKVRQEYRVHGYETESCGNLYAAVIERSLTIAQQEKSYLGLIVPLSICGGERFKQLRTTIRQHTRKLWLANFEIFPSRLFDGAFQRLSIMIAQHGQSAYHGAHVTKIQRWYASERPHLIDLISYTTTTALLRPSVFPKLASPLQESIVRKVLERARGVKLEKSLFPQRTDHFVYYQEATNYWMKAVCKVPFYQKNG